MDCDEANAYGGHHSVLMGAIFMCNRTTKQECLERKLFGLPSRQAGFLKKVKAGMLLFLFEHEERKLYGVFEATSDGALNIMPNAFLSSGKSYPAQVLFKRIWFCKPLAEDEFRDAIKENYFQPYKFNFGLSYDQVFRLIHLFSFKKIRVRQFQRGMPNNLIKQFENSYLGKEKARGKLRSTSFNSYDHKSLLTSDDAIVGSQHGPYATIPCASRTMPDLTRSSSQNDHALLRTFPVTSFYEHHYHHSLPVCGDEIPSIALGMNHPSLAEELNTRTRSFSDTQVPYVRSQLPLMSDRKTFELPSSNCRSFDIPASDETYKGSSLPTCEPSRVSSDFIGSVGCHKPFAGSGGCNDLQDFKHSSIPDHHDSSTSKILATPGMNMTKGIDSMPSLHCSGNSHGDPRASLLDDGPSGQQCWVLGPSRDYIPLSEKDNDVNNTEFSHFHGSRSKDMSIRRNSSSESDESKDYEELGTYRVMHDDGYDVEYYPSSGLHSDNYQKRNSVFSRLSKDSGKHGQYKVVYEPDRNLSLDQLLNVLCQRRDFLSNMDKMMPQKSSIQDDDEQFEKIADMEQTLAASVGELEPNSEEVAEASTEIPFLNFKRRSEVRRMEGGNEAHAGIEGCRDEGLLGKRRRLVRPSFSDNECRKVQISSQEIVMGSVLVKKGEAESTIDGDSSVTANEESGNDNNSSPVDCTLSCVVENKLEIDSNDSTTSVNDAAGRCLLKHRADLTDVSTGNTKHEEKANNALQAGSIDLSVLQGYNKSCDQKFGAVKAASLIKTDNIESEDFLSLEVGDP